MTEPPLQGAEIIAARAVKEFFRNLSEGRFARNQAAELLELTADPESAQIGLRALFADLIERLNDSFDPGLCAVHDKLLAQMIEFYRRRPECALLDATLDSFGLRDEHDLLARRNSLGSKCNPLEFERIQRVLALSRVTIGADVAVTSVIINQLNRAVPGAEIVWIGPHKLAELYGGDPGIRLRPLDYARTGRVVDRLNAWLGLLDAIRDEMRGFDPAQVLIVDPDSRLTQLGMLPVTSEDRNYHFFESRSYRAQGSDALGELAAQWSEERFPATGREHAPSPSPFLCLPDHMAQSGAENLRRFRSGRSHPVTCVSFGVGGNDLKRVSEEFELELLARLAMNSLLILDSGASPQEIASTDRIVGRLRETGRIVAVGTEHAQMPLDIDLAEVLVWRGGIGSLAAIVRASDIYVGYDSAGQHIAAAFGVASLTVFVNNATPKFAARWRPTGHGAIEVLELSRRDADSVRASDLADEVLRIRKKRDNGTN
ncbi:MAG: hypothetical protein KF868_02930 [Acidobacteria bacterium]|nr:hypothetical protein [Acidobacteriota bacterium]MCW5970000.1 hypothetical protein [Blastocatellales bacterium]